MAILSFMQLLTNLSSTTLECCALVVPSALLISALFPQNHNRTIVCYTTTL